MPQLDTLFRTWRRGTDRSAALDADDREIAARLAVVDDAYRADVGPFVRDRSGYFLGYTPIGSDLLPVHVSPRIMDERSSVTTGATGTGKTVLQVMLALETLARGNAGLVASDYQGHDSGFAKLLAEHALPGLAMRLPPERGAELLLGVRVFAPWLSSKLPSFHLTAPGGSASRRAAAIIDVFAATCGVGAFGPRMLALTTPATRALILTGTPLPLLAEFLTNERFRRALTIAAGDPDLTSYVEHRFAADFREAGASVLARLDRFFADESTKLSMYAPDPFDPAAWLESGTTILNLGGGTSSHRAFWASFVQHALLSAALARQATRSSRRVVIRIDEAQVGLPGEAQARELDDALSRVRSRKVAIAIAHQHAGQLSSYPFLRESLKANCGYMLTFRVPEETIVQNAFPLPDSLPPGVSSGLSEAQVRSVWTRVLTSLPDRTFLVRVPTLSPASVPVVAAHFDVEAFGRDAPEDIRALAREGQGGYPRADLAARETVWRRTAEEIARAAEPNVDALARLARRRAPARAEPDRDGAAASSIVEVG